MGRDNHIIGFLFRFANDFIQGLKPRSTTVTLTLRDQVDLRFLFIQCVGADSSKAVPDEREGDTIALDEGRRVGRTTITEPKCKDAMGLQVLECLVKTALALVVRMVVGNVECVDPRFSHALSNQDGR